MYDHHPLFSLLCDVAFFWGWLACYDLIVPPGGTPRVLAVAGMIALLAGYLEVSAAFNTRWDLSYTFDAWAMPLTMFDKGGFGALCAGILMLVFANRGCRQSPRHSN